MGNDEVPCGTQQGDGAGEFAVSPDAVELVAGDGRAWF